MGTGGQTSMAIPGSREGGSDRTGRVGNSTELAQRIDITLHRENARAILRRVPPMSDARVDASPEAWDEHGAGTDTDA